jgi:uncharacterized protein YkwD
VGRFEHLESRELPSAVSLSAGGLCDHRAAGRAPVAEVRASANASSGVTAKLVNGILTVVGTAGSDVIDVRTYKNGQQIGVAGKRFQTSQVNRISVAGEGGDDRITIASTITKPTDLFGGTGNDTICGGSGADILYGGHGNDILNGGKGNDVLFGGPGNDTLVPSSGSDKLYQGSPARSATMDSFEMEIVRLVNVERKKKGLPALKADKSLAAASLRQVSNMVALSEKIGDNAALNHTLFGARQPTMITRFDYAGFEWRAAAENIAFGYRTAAEVTKAWMNSPGHRANILSSQVDRIGVAVGSNSHGTKFFCQNFGMLL